MARKKKMNEGAVYQIAEILLIVGGLAWGLFGLFGNFNLVETIFGADSFIGDIVFTLVGVAAVWLGIYKISMIK